MRRSLALTSGALALATLSSCGFNYATDEIYNAATGTDARSSKVDVLSAVIVASEDDHGAFVATFANNDPTRADRVTAIEGGVNDPTFESDMSSVSVPAGGYVNLAETHGIPVSGDFTAGDFVEVSVEFGNADGVTFLVPVVAPTGPYADFGDGTVVEPAPEDDHH